MDATDKKRIQVKIDKDLASDVEEVLDDLGLTPTTAITMFYKRIAGNGRIPFDVALTEEEKLNRELEKATRSLPRKEVTQKDMAEMIKNGEW